MFAAESGGKIFARLTCERAITIVEQLLAILRLLPADGQFDRFLSRQTELLPRYFSEILTDAKGLLPGAALHNLFWLEAQKPQPAARDAVRHVAIDLKTETVKKGSPHTLRITKTQAAYERQMKTWTEDVALLEQLKRKGEGTG